MGKKLWFITDGIEPIEVYGKRAQAESRMSALEREEDEEYELYSVDVDELDDYPMELELAEESGLV